MFFNMIEVEVDPNLVVFGFWCKCLGGGVMTAIFEISGNDCHAR